MTTFRQAIESCTETKGHYKTGIEALDKAHRSCIQISDTRLLTGSVNIDSALAKIPAHSQANRWDYAVGYKCGNKQTVAWIEVHAANAGEIGTMLRKLAWLKNWLSQTAVTLNTIPRPLGYVWIATEAKVHLTKNSPQAKRLAKAGLNLPTRKIVLA